MTLNENILIIFSGFSLEIEDSFNKSLKIRQEILENKIKDEQHREKLEEQEEEQGSEEEETDDATRVDDNYKSLNPCPENEEIEKEDKKSMPTMLVNYKINLIENNEDFDTSRDQNYLKLEKDINAPNTINASKYYKREKIKATINSEEKEANYSDSAINTEILQETPVHIGRLRRRQTPNKENVEIKKITQEVIGHVCDLCGKSYQRKTGLKRHVSTFHKKEKPFSCETCDKKFGRIDSLVKHGLTHTMEKNLICEICSKAFNQSSNLIKHR